MGMSLRNARLGKNIVARIADCKPTEWIKRVPNGLVPNGVGSRDCYVNALRIRIAYTHCVNLKRRGSFTNKKTLAFLKKSVILITEIL